MSNTQNWNQMTSSEDEDSWFDDDEEIKPKTQSTDKNKDQKASEPQIQSKKQGQTQGIDHQQNKQQKQINKKYESKRPQKQYSNKFPTDGELLKKYKDKEVDDPHVIKVVKCMSEENKQILQKLNLKRMREGGKEGIYILQFYQAGDLIKFIEEKMANRYKFYLHLYFKGKSKQQREKNSERNDKYERRPRQQKKEYEKNRQRYNNDKQDNKQKYNGERQQKQRQKRPKQQQKSKKVYIIKDNFEIVNKQNIINIKNDKFDVERALQELDAKKIFKQFSRLKIKTPFNIFSKVSELVYKIGNQYKWFLQEQPLNQAQPEKIIQLILNQKTSFEKTYKFYERYHTRQKIIQPIPLAKVHKIQKIETKIQEKVQSKAKVRNRTLGQNIKQYFENIPKSNLSEIIKGFDENEYIKLLKQNHNQIFQSKWNVWKIEAQEDQIEHLLKLQHRLKKSNLYDIELKPSTRNDKPILTIQIKIRPEKQRRPKVDVSGINDFLS